MPDQPTFVELQHAFARHLRDPGNVPPPGTHEERRLAIYRHAVKANVARFMADNYPRVRAVMSDLRWESMLHDYITRHVSRTSVFAELPLEFIAYLEHEREDQDDPPFLRELAHFDWLETLVGVDVQVIDFSDIDREGDLLAGIPVVNPTLRLVTYAFPVHAITADFQPREAPAQVTRIAAFRDPANRYGFLDLNPTAAELIEILQQGRAHNGREVLTEMARTRRYPDVPGFLDAGSTILVRMLARGALLGTLR